MLLIFSLKLEGKTLPHFFIWAMDTSFFQALSFGPQGWGDELFSGLQVTLFLAFATLPFGVFLGLCIAWLRFSSLRFLRMLGNGYATFFRGVPELLTLLIIYYGGQILLHETIETYLGIDIEISPFLAGMIALSLVFSAYASEVFLGAFNNIRKTDWEAAKALGLTSLQTIFLVILPHFLRLCLPGISNLWLVLLRETSLVSIIALDDLLRKTSIAVGVTKKPIFFYTVCCLIYLVISAISILGIRKIERWSRRGTV